MHVHRENKQAHCVFSHIILCWVLIHVCGVGHACGFARNFNNKTNTNNDDDSLAQHADQHLVATGQVGKAPFICVWDTRTCEHVSILKDNHERGIATLDFGGPDDKLLVSVGMDNGHRVVVWDWAKGQVIATAKGHGDEVSGVV